MGFKGSSNLVAKGYNLGDFVLIYRLLCGPLLTVQVSSHDAFDFDHMHAQL